MESKAVSGLIVTLLFTSMLTSAFSIQQVEASEPPPTEWSETYGGAGYDFAVSVIQTSDGGYAMTGETNSFGAGGRDFWLVKTDSAGNIEWNKTYGGAGSDYGRSVVQTVDGGYAITGWTYSFGAGSADFWLVKVDSSGNMQWSKTYGGPNPDYGRCVVQTADGGYAITGGTYSFGAGDRDFWLVKVGTPSVPPSVPEFPLGLELMMALALAIPIVYLWRNRKMLGQC